MGEESAAVTQDRRTPLQRDVEAHLGFRIVPLTVKYPASEGRPAHTAKLAQFQRLDEKGKVVAVAPANSRELEMFRLLTTPQKEWG